MSSIVRTATSSHKPLTTSPSTRPISKRAFDPDDASNRGLSTPASKRQKPNAPPSTNAKSDTDLRTKRKPTNTSTEMSIPATKTANISTLPADFFDTSKIQVREASSVSQEMTAMSAQGGVGESGGEGEIDEDEWAAFQAEVIQPTYAATTAGVSSAVISAAPVLTANLTAKDGGNNNSASTGAGEGGGEAGNPRNEADDEAEDARQKLVEEFEEMESLEQRVLRLKQQREALRSLPATTKMEIVAPAIIADNPEADESEEDEEDEDWIHFSR